MSLQERLRRVEGLAQPDWGLLHLAGKAAR